MARRRRLPMPRDLKEPEGWRFSSLRNIWLGGAVNVTGKKAARSRKLTSLLLEIGGQN
jgi:hypothetical protein